MDDSKQGMYKYQILKQHLLRNIQCGGYGAYGKVESEPALQRQFGLSRNTIRQAIKELEHEGYVYRIRGKGTFIKNISPQNSQKIALIIYDSSYMTNYVTGNLIRGIDFCLSKNGYTLDILAGKRDFNREKVDHLTTTYAGFLIGAYQIDHLILQALIKSGRPCLFVKNYPDSHKHLAVRIDYEKAGFLAAEHLIQCGCKNLGMLNGPETMSISRDFFNGVRNAAAEYGVQLKRLNCLQCPFPIPERAADMAEHFIKAGTDGIICASDEFALNIAEKLIRKVIKIPQNIQITGCNNNPVCQTKTLSFTSIKIPVFELGEVAAAALLKKISGTDDQLPEMLSPELIIKNSTKRISSC
ncbi:MAG: substrate-binding domain-containing protein [Lentisphaeria bacterium]|nr:substrate-binding domain-containing protein [Lentisphaeria bacterium]